MNPFAQIPQLTPEAAKVLGEIGGALLLVIAFLFLFLFACLGLLVRRMDRMGDRIGRMIGEINAAHGEELKQAFAMISVLLDQHMDSTRRAIRDARDAGPAAPVGTAEPSMPRPPAFGPDPEAED
jgi:hypothetical protein